MFELFIAIFPIMISGAPQYTVVLPNALPMLGQWYITVLSIPGPLFLLDADALICE